MNNSNDYHNDRTMEGVNRGLEQHQTLKQIMAKAIELEWVHVSFSRKIETIGNHQMTGTSFLPDVAEDLPEVLTREATFNGEVTMYFNKPAVSGGSLEGISKEMFFTIDPTGIVSWSSSANRAGDLLTWLEQIIA